MQHIPTSIQRTANKHVMLQFLCLIIVSAIAAIITPHQVAFSYFLGGLVCVIPNFYFAKRFCRQSGAQNTKNIMADVYKAEFFKLFLTGVIFWLIFTFIPVTITPLFVGFISAQAAFWFSITILRHEKTVKIL